MSVTTNDLQPTLATSGDEAYRQLSMMRARVTARYKLKAVPGRGEELILPGTDKGISFGYGCKTVRVRKMTGRNWDDTIDFQIRPDWTNELTPWLDAHFGVGLAGHTLADVHSGWSDGNYPRQHLTRPIRDNPQA